MKKRLRDNGDDREKRAHIDFNGEG